MRFLTQRQSLLLTNAVDKFVEQVNSFYKGQPHLVSLIIMSVSNDDSFYLLQALKINPVISAAVQSARYNFNNPPIQIISNTNDVEIDEKSVIDEIKLMVLMRLNEHLSNSIKATCLQTDITENQKNRLAQELDEACQNLQALKIENQKLKRELATPVRSSMSSKQEKTTGIPPYVPCYAAKPPQIRRDLRNTALTNSGIQLVSAAQEGISLWLLAANVAAANKYQSNPPKKIEELLKTIDQLSNCLLGIISENKHNEIIIGNNKVNVQYREDITYVIELLQHEFTNELQKKEPFTNPFAELLSSDMKLGALKDLLDSLKNGLIATPSASSIYGFN